MSADDRFSVEEVVEEALNAVLECDGCVRDETEIRALEKGCREVVAAVLEELEGALMHYNVVGDRESEGCAVMRMADIAERWGLK